MRDISILNHGNQRVLTTQQLAEVYKTTVIIISNNFNRNKDHYKEGKHFILLEGIDLQEFKAIHQFDEYLKYVPKLYLWTEKGAWLHAKSLNTEKAWESYELLVDEYYNIKEQVPQMSQIKMINVISSEMMKQEERLTLLEDRVNEQITLDHGQMQSLNQSIRNRVESIKNDYPGVDKRLLYSKIHKNLRAAFSSPSYRVIRKKDYEDAISWVRYWRPLL